MPEQLEMRLSGAAARTAAAVDWAPPPDHGWTREVVEPALRFPDLDTVTARVHEELARGHVVLPDADNLVRRCVHALLVGHLVLQGPPGTGKTTFARALAAGFRAELSESTATSDWTPFHVVGGLRPDSGGGFSASHGHVVAAALRCAELVQAGGETQANWLLIDEFNRADIDKAIGSLFTVLASCDADHLRKTPVELWFEAEPAARKLWIPARFRIIASMNDLDTYFVNRISQGLTRRFQFVTVGVPEETGTAEQPVTEEFRQAYANAHDWLTRTYALEVPADTEWLARLQSVVDRLRHPENGASWPVGTAQVVDVLRVVLLRLASGAQVWPGVDEAIADRMVPQMAGIDDEQASSFLEVFTAHGLATAARELRHLIGAP
ncbi:AAA family ATPase [Sciscionella sediminilitoris]|uniref:AAA family ATPase n=1 Tax=Sciscionella sediminilitoris TaxID=1445613 RepID=UPI00068A2E49|nr:AAA family ATPase [Sciscionella sp. SE31]